MDITFDIKGSILMDCNNVRVNSRCKIGIKWTISPLNLIQLSCIIDLISIYHWELLFCSDQMIQFWTLIRTRITWILKRDIFKFSNLTHQALQGWHPVKNYPRHFNDLRSFSLESSALKYASDNFLLKMARDLIIFNVSTRTALYE